ncbi:MAG TPA: hypothetical protein VE990_16180 [Acidimicrobiales bacterium]|nr:hypothetical protein [Acidimicrobiales bacterium]
MRFAIKVTNSHGFNLRTIGVILMIVGGIGFLLSCVFWSSWGGFHRTTSTVGGAPVTTRRESVVREREGI